MFAKLVLLFTIIPLIELSLLVTLGTKIGLVPTLVIVAVTALLGAGLGKYQGLKAWRGIKEELARGQLPQDSLLDGLAVLLASAFLVTPGVLTDFTAFILLIPVTRAPVKKLIRKRVDKWLEKENMGFFSSGPSFGFDNYHTSTDYSSSYAHSRSDDIIIEPSTKQDTHEPEVVFEQISSESSRS